MPHRARIGSDPGEDGFTLVELLVVITILAILAAIVVFSVSGIHDRGQASACQADYNQITNAEEAYLAKESGSLSYVTYTDTSSPLITSGLLKGLSQWYAVTGADAHGYTIVSLDNSVCTSPPS